MELNELSESVYKHLIRSAVPDVTSSEIIDIISNHANNNPLNHESFISNVSQSDDIPKEGPIEFFNNVAKMVLLSDDPIRKAFKLAIEYINEDGIMDEESIEERSDALTNLFKYRVECLRDESPLDSESESELELIINEDSEDDLDD